MLELTGFGSVLRGIGFLYWTLAIGAVVLAVKYGKGILGKVIATTIVLAVFGYLPGKAMVEQHQRDTYAKAAWAYFKMKCDTESGEKIYKTFTGVKSVLIVKPLPPATETDLRDQFWYGDPYSSASIYKRPELAASILADPAGITADGRLDRGFDFVESLTPGEHAKYVKVSYPTGSRKSAVEQLSMAISKFGITWEDTSTAEDRKYWVASSRLRILDLTDNTIVAERMGFMIEPGFGSTAGQRSPWLTGRGARSTCPTITDGHFEDRWFVLKVLNPASESENGK